MSFGRVAVVVGEAAPGFEAHDAIRVKQQDRGTLDAECLVQAFQGRSINLFKGTGAAQRGCQLIECMELVQTSLEVFRSACVGSYGVGAMLLAPACRGRVSSLK